MKESTPRDPWILEREHRETERVDGKDHTVIARIETIIARGAFTQLGAGQSADVIVLTDPEHADGSWVIKQETGGHGKQQELGLTFEDEFALHQRAYEVVERAQAYNKRKSYAHIPRPYSLIRANEKNWLLMERMDGETLFERAAKLLVLTYETDDEAREEVQTMKKGALVDNLLKSYGTAFDDEHFLRIANEAYRYTKTPCSILTPEQYKALRNTMDELHRHGVHHRDLHASNVMLLKNDDVAVIDFGASIQVEMNDPAATTDIYTLKTQQIDERTERKTRMRSDAAMLGDFAKIVR